MIPEVGPLLKLAGYSGLIKPINEEELLQVLPTFKTNKCNMTIFSSDKKVDVDDMPGLAERLENRLLLPLLLIGQERTCFLLNQIQKPITTHLRKLFNDLATNLEP